MCYDQLLSSAHILSHGICAEHHQQFNNLNPENNDWYNSFENTQPTCCVVSIAFSFEFNIAKDSDNSSTDSFGVGLSSLTKDGSKVTTSCFGS